MIWAAVAASGDATEAAAAPAAASAAATGAVLRSAPPLHLPAEAGERLSRVRAVFETKFGEIEFAFLPEVAPVTAAHIFRLVALGAYAGCHFFRVDRGFVAQVSEAAGGRPADWPPLSDAARAEAAKTVPLEVRAGVRHVAGVLSMGRFDDPNSGTSSFSILLGPAPHLDMQYTVFGRVTRGMDALRRMEGVETRREGIFVMPKERVTIYATRWHVEGQQPLSLRSAASAASAAAASAADGADGAANGVGGARKHKRGSSGGGGGDGGGALHTHGLGSAYCERLQDDLDALQGRYNWCSEELQRVRHKCLPG